MVETNTLLSKFEVLEVAGESTLQSALADKASDVNKLQDQFFAMQLQSGRSAEEIGAMLNEFNAAVAPKGNDLGNGVTAIAPTQENLDKLSDMATSFRSALEVHAQSQAVAVAPEGQQIAHTPLIVQQHAILANTGPDADKVAAIVADGTGQVAEKSARAAAIPMQEASLADSKTPSSGGGVAAPEQKQNQPFKP